MLSPDYPQEDIRMLTRRDVIGRISGALASPVLLSRSDAEVTPDVLKFSGEIEPLVALIERTPRDRCQEMAVEQLRSGVSYREFLAALFLAGIRNINPRPPGFALHCVFVVHSAHLLSLEAPPDARLLPLFFVLDDFKASQDRDAHQPSGDFTMRELRGALPAADRAATELIAAMEAWDPEAAERAAVSLARSRSGSEVFAMLWRYGARDYRNIGHKAIFVANACRTLHAIGWEYAEPVLRSLVLALLDFKRDQKINGYALADQCYDANVKRLAKSVPRWEYGAADAQATRSIVEAIRQASPDEACADVAARLSKAQATPASVWDAVHLADAELRIRARKGAALASIHAVTSANALHYAWMSASDPRDRALLLLQAVGWAGQFRTAASARPDDLRESSILDLRPADGNSPSPGGLAEIYASVPAKPDEAASRVMQLASDTQARRAYLAGAIRLNAAKANEVHYYKYLAALIEDLPLVSPAWQSHLLATTVYYLKGSADPDPAPMRQAREAMRTLV
jgi:hypothetical protein